MKVLLREDVESLGYAGEVHKVAPGYGRNYLLPRGLAVMATPSMMKQATVWRKKADARRESVAGAMASDQVSPPLPLAKPPTKKRRIVLANAG